MRVPANELIVNRKGPVTQLQMSREGKRNSLSPALVHALHGAVQACAQDGTRLMVLEGVGRHFCAGFDLSELEDETDDTLLARFVRIELMLQAVALAPFSTCSIARGATIGAGADLFTACDVRLATADAFFSFPGAGFGIVLGTARLAQRIGESQAQRLVSSGVRVNATEAKALGLVTQIVDDSIGTCHVSDSSQYVARLPDSTHRAVLTAARTYDAQQARRDLAALVHSAAVPGLKERIQRYAGKR